MAGAQPDTRLDRRKQYKEEKESLVKGKQQNCLATQHVSCRSTLAQGLEHLVYAFCTKVHFCLSSTKIIY